MSFPRSLTSSGTPSSRNQIPSLRRETAPGDKGQSDDTKDIGHKADTSPELKARVGNDVAIDPATLAAIKDVIVKTWDTSGDARSHDRAGPGGSNFNDPGNQQAATTTTAAGASTVVSANAAPGFNFNNGGGLGNPGSFPAGISVATNSHPSNVATQGAANFGGLSGSGNLNVSDNSLLAFNYSAGAISGSGSLTHAGAGMLTLNGAATYSDGSSTTPDAQNVQQGAVTDDLPPTNPVTSSAGATLQLDNVNALHAGALTNNDRVDLSGSISGSGAYQRLVRQGSPWRLRERLHRRHHRQVKNCRWDDQRLGFRKYRQQRHARAQRRQHLLRRNDDQRRHATNGQWGIGRVPKGRRVERFEQRH